MTIPPWGIVMAGRLGTIFPPRALTMPVLVVVTAVMVVVVVIPVTRVGRIDRWRYHHSGCHRLHAYRVLGIVNSPWRGRWGRDPLPVRPLCHARADQATGACADKCPCASPNRVADDGAGDGTDSRADCGADFVSMGSLAGNYQCGTRQTRQRADEPTGPSRARKEVVHGTNGA